MKILDVEYSGMLKTRWGTVFRGEVVIGEIENVYPVRRPECPNILADTERTTMEKAEAIRFCVKTYGHASLLLSKNDFEGFKKQYNVKNMEDLIGKPVRVLERKNNVRDIMPLTQELESSESW